MLCFSYVKAKIARITLKTALARRYPQTETRNLIPKIRNLVLKIRVSSFGYLIPDIRVQATR